MIAGKLIKPTIKQDEDIQYEILFSAKCLTFLAWMFILECCLIDFQEDSILVIKQQCTAV